MTIRDIVFLASGLWGRSNTTCGFSHERLVSALEYNLRLSRERPVGALEYDFGLSRERLVSALVVRLTTTFQYACF
jgi:hypothetical protein